MVKQSIETVSADMEIDESIEVQKKGWIIQRIGWILMGVFILLAALGMFGNGVLSKQAITSGEQQLEYPRFARYESRLELKFVLNSSDGANVISFPSQYLHHFRIESILPEPDRNQVSDGFINYFFEGRGPVNIKFYIVPQTMGSLQAAAWANRSKFIFNHFIYP